MAPIAVVLAPSTGTRSVSTILRRASYSSSSVQLPGGVIVVIVVCAIVGLVAMMMGCASAQKKADKEKKKKEEEEARKRAQEAQLAQVVQFVEQYQHLQTKDEVLEKPELGGGGEKKEGGEIEGKPIDFRTVTDLVLELSGGETRQEVDHNPGRVTVRDV
ncbi:hypothetical protein EJ04DRAFT_510003 [Polyplosphaeria fusca]|uniref:Uncharacterized protein n=1 Tax=Polyplosphaeria fusca TaxID=682080 RepID=A0A9P4R249_9PLEO|nr:hypothetical protein EJ04DRAFT_510003 [Polyplosphaeria fusca]